MVPGFLSIFELVCRACYLLENCGARRAALRPYFFLSFILGSRVRKPAFFSFARRFFGIVLEQRSRDAVADRAGLAGDAAACNAADNVELLVGLGEDERLTDDGLQGVKAEVIVDVAVVDRDLARAW